MFRKMGKLKLIFFKVRVYIQAYINLATLSIRKTCAFLKGCSNAAFVSKVYFCLNLHVINIQHLTKCDGKSKEITFPGLEVHYG